MEVVLGGGGGFESLEVLNYLLVLRSVGEITFNCDRVLGLWDSMFRA